MNGSRIRLPADVEMEDRLAWGLTARQLVILTATALLCYGTFTAASSTLPLPVAVAFAAPLALAGVALALGRLDGLSGDRLALALVRHVTQSPRRVAAPDGLAAPLASAPSQPGVSLLRVPVKTILASGVVELSDGTSALLISASGTSWALRSPEEQAALSEAYGRWLNSLVEATAITVRSEPVDLTERASAIEHAAIGLPHPALRGCAESYARFLAGLASQGEGLRRRQILIVLSSRSRERDTATAELQRRASETEGLLHTAGVELHPLDGHQAADLLLSALEPPGPPAGSQLQGVIHRC
ncbi:MAG: PrgI family protein [Solirubrobacteraceae bacterium]